MLSEFEDQYLDVLQNIEWALLSLVVDHPDLSDHDLRRIVEQTLAYYKSLHKETTIMQKFTGIHQEIFEKVLSICNWRLKSSPKKNICAPITIEELILCLKRIEKSIKFWTKQGGRKGYINFAMTHALVSNKNL